MSFRFFQLSQPQPSFRAFVIGIGITETIGLLAAGSADGCFFRLCSGQFDRTVERVRIAVIGHDNVEHIIIANLDGGLV